VCVGWWEVGCVWYLMCLGLFSVLCVDCDCLVMCRCLAQVGVCIIGGHFPDVAIGCEVLGVFPEVCWCVARNDILRCHNYWFKVSSFILGECRVPVLVFTDRWELASVEKV
jgi:hypothetical protein